MKETTYVMVKPGFASKPEVIREIAKRLKENGLNIAFHSYVRYTEDTARMHYYEHVEKPFYPELKEYITSSKAFGMVVEGENAVAVVRELCGATKNPAQGSIRFDIPQMLNMPCRVTENVVHSSDSVESAKKEMEIFNLIVMRNEVEETLSL